MSQTVKIIGRDPALLAAMREEFSPEFDLLCLDSPSAKGANGAAHGTNGSSVRAVVAQLGPRMIGSGSPAAYLAEVQAAAGSASVYVALEADCPLRVREIAAEAADACVMMPEGRQKLGQLVRQQPDPALDLAGFFSGLPSKVLHGRSRSMVTFAPQMFEMIDELKVAAAHDVTVLLIGETGSGKTYLARLIHELSQVADEQIYTVACGALPPDLIESELFGYVRGAFTGADRDKLGKFAAAGRGTLLLDEIDVLPMEQQAKLLRVIETGEYEPVGSNETHYSQARLVVASNYDLEQLVAAGTFRRDLYYRLNILKFHLLPLRERPADIEFLARNFALMHSRKHNIQLREIDDQFLSALKAYHWPGNIRELENVIRRSVLYCRRGVLSVEDLPSMLRPEGSKEPLPVAETVSTKSLESRVGVMERRIIEDTLRRNAHHRQATAEELGISRVTLYNKMKKFGMLN
ncbi:MAG: sigma 54-interacting transcriptional regulator [Planctomycetia bacterium]|nr:sigma 54-interacting transcriptional regulator [Planctomycetia bacterium]